ncbi:MAG: glycine/sarcosine/betaine reductase component B subunit [bacterium]|nr:glycine/sarcosine/betaine reductase component B subunit [bacterium]
MTLILHEFDVADALLASQTAYSAGELSIDAEALTKELKHQDPRIKDVRFTVVHPGESTRILCVKDALAPMCKAKGVQLGAGISHCLNNLAVVTCGPIVAFQEGIIDMSGPGAAYSPFASLILLVVEISVASITPHQHEETVRHAGMYVAEALAKTTINQHPDQVQEIVWGESDGDPSLPRVAYLSLQLSQGLLHDNYLRRTVDSYGVNVKQELPSVIDPRLVLDGGLVSGNCVSACDKTTTYHHQKNPVILELLAGQGIRWNFVGMVLSHVPTRLAEKRQAAKTAVDMLRELNAEGVVVTKEGFGNPDADMMMIIRWLEQAGVKTVAISDEFAGPEGDSQSLADATPEADALVSTGNANQRIKLPPMRKVIGPLPDVARLAGGYPHSLHHDGALEIELQAIVGATNQLGYSFLSCREV